jgi:hypothetical protein
MNITYFNALVQFRTSAKCLKVERQKNSLLKKLVHICLQNMIIKFYRKSTLELNLLNSKLNHKIFSIKVNSNCVSLFL